MESLNLFQRKDRTRQRSMLIALILLALSIVAIIAGVLFSRQAQRNYKAFSSAAKPKDQVLLKADRISDSFAEETSNKKKYYYLLAGQGKDISVVRVDSATWNILEDLVQRKVDLRDTPYTFAGTIERSDYKLRPHLSDYWKRLMGNTLSPTNPVYSFQLNTLRQNPIGIPFYIGGGIGLIGALVALIISLSTRRNARKSREKFQAYYPELTDFEVLDRDLRYEDPILGLRVYKDLAFTTKGSIQIADLRDTIWVYLEFVTSRYGTRSYFYFHRPDGKRYTMNLQGRKKVVQAQADHFYTFIQDNYPQIEVGYSREQYKGYKEFVKEQKKSGTVS
ncbi:hypothetical protein ABB02_01849 [Clostridiaceae bacterium JG1575]|nr:hypothetical protein ABB02_01849 [Clostridiaceae bacterium JG1575]